MDCDDDDFELATIIIGIIAGILTSTALLPQVLRAYVVRSNASLYWVWLSLAGQVLWLVYGCLGVAGGNPSFAPTIVFAVVTGIMLSVFVGTILNYPKNTDLDGPQYGYQSDGGPISNALRGFLTGNVELRAATP